ncbi:hypothetical protein HanXRQr2_Chr12g0536541 [Helianthus annuus]|uniref:Uncharacterized protein n=1 Tax=Helianthus annuus TaxID=4232 RepID=A0A251T1E1_HELAN|nr:hypothetical protein HanXRQr2_Chr12g0536541 [Helianthus annuus]KAJ0862319.1 hypothetical protein HanPSC8_Chr12g0516791 [Helianthus annuus]
MVVVLGFKEGERERRKIIWRVIRFEDLKRFVKMIFYLKKKQTIFVCLGLYHSVCVFWCFVKDLCEITCYFDTHQPSPFSIHPRTTTVKTEHRRLCSEPAATPLESAIMYYRRG